MSIKKTLFKSSEIQVANFEVSFSLAQLNRHNAANFSDVLEKDQELFMSSVFDLHDSSNDLIEENSSDLTPSPPVATSIVDCSSSTPLTTGSSLVENFMMFEKNLKNNKDVIKECHNVFLEKYLEKNRVGRKSKLHNTIKCKLTNANTSSNSMSRICINEKSKMKLSRSFDTTSRSYSSLNSHLTDSTLNESIHESSGSIYLPANVSPHLTTSAPKKSVVSDRMAINKNINLINQQCYSLNFYDEAYSNSTHAASFRHTSSFSEFCAPLSQDSSATSYIDQQRQHFGRLNTLSENAVTDSNSSAFQYYKRTDSDHHHNNKLSHILNGSDAYNNSHISNTFSPKDEYDGWKSNKYLKQYSQRINEEDTNKSFNYEIESKDFTLLKI
jgi:hypothetical protein